MAYGADDVEGDEDGKATGGDRLGIGHSAGIRAGGAIGFRWPWKTRGERGQTAQTTVHIVSWWQIPQNVVPDPLYFRPEPV